MLPFLAGHAARQLDPDKAEAFRLELGRAYHLQGRPYTLETILDIAKDVGLEELKAHLQDAGLRGALAKEHAEAAANHVSGTPTFRFASGDQSYFRMADLPKTQEDAVRLFSSYHTLLTEFPFVQNVKRHYEVRRSVAKKA